MLSSLRAPLWTGAKRVNMRVSQRLHLQKKKKKQRVQCCGGREGFPIARQLENPFYSCQAYLQGTSRNLLDSPLTAPMCTID